MLLKKCGDYDVMGQVQPSGCYSSLQWKDFSGHAQGTGLMGVQTVALRAALGTRVPSDADTCQPPAPWVLRRCPGAAGGACAPGSGRLTGRLDGCCACRRTRFVVPYTSVYEPTSAIGYYGNTPNCLLPGPYRALPAGTMVHYTGAMVTGNPRLGCQARRYAQIVMEVRGQGRREPFLPGGVAGAAAGAAAAHRLLCWHRGGALQQWRMPLPSPPPPCRPCRPPPPALCACPPACPAEPAQRGGRPHLPRLLGAGGEPHPLRRAALLRPQQRAGRQLPGRRRLLHRGGAGRRARRAVPLPAGRGGPQRVHGGVTVPACRPGRPLFLHQPVLSAPICHPHARPCTVTRRRLPTLGPINPLLNLLLLPAFFALPACASAGWPGAV